MKKSRLCTLILAISLLISSIGVTGQASAAINTNTKGTLSIYEYHVVEWNGNRNYVNEAIQWSEVNKEWYITAQSFAKIFNLSFAYDKAGKVITFKDKNHTYQLILGSKMIKVDGAENTIKTPSETLEGQVSVPLSLATSLFQASVYFNNYFTEELTMYELPNEAAYSNAYNKVSAPYDQVYAQYSKAFDAFEQAKNQNLYFVQGSVVSPNKVQLWGTTESQSSHIFAELSSEGNIVVQNPDRSKMTNNYYSGGYHYYIKAGTGHDMYGRPVSIYYFGPASAAQQKNINNKKAALTQAEAKLQSVGKSYDTAVNNWIKAVKDMYKKKGSFNDPKILGKMAMHLKYMSVFTGSIKMEQEAESVANILYNLDKRTYWLVKTSFNGDDFRERFTALYDIDKALALSIVGSPEQYKAAAEITYDKRSYVDSLTLANIAKSSGLKMDNLIVKINKKLDETAAQLAEKQAETEFQANIQEEMPKYKEWEQEYLTILKKFKQDYVSKHGNAQYFDQLSWEEQNALITDMNAQYAVPVEKLRERLESFQYVNTEEPLQSIVSLRHVFGDLSTYSTEARTLAHVKMINALTPMGLKL
ncbi:stalk domain-containing protein [Paenibacillus sp. UMB4589-SE434]|uniref:stalk domain-containing protein n=1 Tax=Paenibacillus sp. UMB4589-SE434 TaxID=3046314 RepID=UPI00254C35FE|nr:stalk domain-containing protein [Paenibacillus sp. UMB4589-SE434]MDK8180011.1 stalk domain-containing protein [Paenibacillus sp. UMB4589-SE434]